MRYEKERLKKFKPPSFVSRPNLFKKGGVANTEILVEVMISSTRSEKITISDNQDPREVAERFCKEFNLPIEG